ncbi:hypothetical protein [Nocardia salmonicida]|uniref:hypothetical protein n=1 Tax=Nocardia salmonicida TaxID=53431 RepID=UPI003CF97D4E
MTWETNVLVPASALPALDAVRRRRGYRSRNKTVVALLEDYVLDQQRLGPDERLMHVATLMRHPPRPREAVDGAPPGVALRLRLDRSLWEAARELGFVVPGQSVRGHADYQARRGADAVLTALARVQPLEDSAVGDHQLLTQRQARRLWQMVVEVTSTRAERKIIEEADEAAGARGLAARKGNSAPVAFTEVELIARRLEQGMSWHGRTRYQLASALVATRLRGPGAASFLTVLSCPEGEAQKAWDDEIHWCWETFGRDDSDVRAYMGTQGRGATAVWRAARAVRLDAVLAWIAASGRISTPRTFTVTPPRWRLQLPEDWVPTTLPAGAGTAGWGEHITTGAVLLIENSGTRYVWPTRAREDESTEPIPGFEVVTRAIGSTDVQRVIEIVLMSTADHHEDDSDTGRRIQVQVPAHVACDLGLITADRRDLLVAEARRNKEGEAYRDFLRDSLRESSKVTWRVMDLDLIFADLDHRYCDADDRERARMAYASGVGPFVRYLRSISHPAVAVGTVETFTWDAVTQFVWPVGSLAALLAAGGAAERALKWLAVRRREQHRLALHADSAERWITAARYAEESHFEPDPDEEDCAPVVEADLEVPVRLHNLWPPVGYTTQEDSPFY